MDLCVALVAVKKELNHIYTEPPHDTHLGPDMGWFCREHALHTAALAGMFGHNVELCHGDVIVRIPGDITICSVGSGAGHYWVRVDSRAPYDLSATIKYFSRNVPDIQVVCPDDTSLLNGFSLSYCIAKSDADFMAIVKGEARSIAYNERQAEQADPLALLNDPVSYLAPPPPGRRSTLELFGPDVFFVITAHCYKLANGAAKPLYPYRAPKEAVRAMVKFNPDARRVVSSKLRKPD